MQSTKTETHAGVKLAIRVARTAAEALWSASYLIFRASSALERAGHKANEAACHAIDVAAVLDEGPLGRGIDR